MGLLYKLSEIDKNCVLSLEKSIKKSADRVLEFVSSLSKRPQKSAFRGAPRLSWNGVASVDAAFVKYRQRLIISSRRQKA